MTNNTGSKFFYATSSDDSIFGFLGAEVIFGLTGNDLIYGDGNSSNSLLNGSSDTIFGNDGNDTIYGQGGNDVLWGGPEKDLIYGDIGNDLIYGDTGNDSLYGGPGDDTLSGGEETDWADGQGWDYIDGGEGYDQLRETGNFTFTLGDTYLTITDTSAWFDAIRSGKATTTDRLVSIESAWLAAGVSNNTLDASRFTGSVTLFGGLGDDYMLGGSSNDYLQGDGGADYLDGGAGNDTIYGHDNGNQTLINQRDTLIGGRGDDLLFGSNGGDRLIGVDSAATNPGVREVDTMTGYGGNDRFILGESGKIFYNDGFTRPIGAVEGFARITDFTPGDTIQLVGGSANYRLLSYSSGGITGTGIYAIRPTGLTITGSTTYNELIAVVQNSSLSALSLTNIAQFVYV